MPTLDIYTGISGSGKSTVARSKGDIVVSRDDIRVMLFQSDGQDYYARKDLKDCEDLVTKFERQAILAALNFGKNVISDNTNIEPKFYNKIAQIGYGVPGVTVTRTVFDVPVATAIERNKQRAALGGRDVPEKVIRSQFSRLQVTKGYELEKAFEVETYTGTPGKPAAFLVDIDGTLAHMRKYRGPFDWHKVHLDDVDDVIAFVVDAIRHGSEFTEGANGDPIKVIVMSGRDESSRVKTEDWLDRHGIWFDQLYMRPEKDQRKDNIIKEELFNAYVRDNYDVRFVLDDRNQVVDMWRAKGIKCLQVEPGNF